MEKLKKCFDSAGLVVKVIGIPSKELKQEYTKHAEKIYANRAARQLSAGWDMYADAILEGDEEAAHVLMVNELLSRVATGTEKTAYELVTKRYFNLKKLREK